MPEVNQAPQLIDAGQVAKMLKVSRSTVFAWARQGLLPSVKMGRCVRFDLVDVRTFIRARRTGANGGS